MLKKFRKSKNKVKPDEQVKSSIPKGEKKGEKKKRGFFKSADKLKEGEIIQSLKIGEGVPSVLNEELEEFSRKRDGAVFKTNEGYIVLVIQNKYLKHTKITDTSNDNQLGELALAIQNERIRSATRLSDKERNQLVIIPSDDTLFEMTTFDAFREKVEVEGDNAHGVIQWGVYPYNATDDDDDDSALTQVTPTPLMTIDEVLALIKAKDGKNVISINLETNEPIYEGDDTGIAEHTGVNAPKADEPATKDDNEPTGDAQPITDDVKGYGMEPDLDEPEFDEPDMDVPNTTGTASAEPKLSLDDNVATNAQDNPEQPVLSLDTPPEPTLSLDTSSESAIDVDSVLSEIREEDELEFGADIGDDEDDISAFMNESANYEDTDTVGAVNTTPRNGTPVEYIADIQALTSYNIDNKDLRIDVVTDMFNELYMSTRPFYFSISETDDDSLLERELNEKRRNYNAELARRHEENVQKLRQIYMDTMQKTAHEVQLSLSTDNNETVIGQEYSDILNEYDHAMAHSQDAIAEFEQNALAELNQEREDFANRAYQQALNEFDIKNEAKKAMFKKTARNEFEKLATSTKTSRLTALHEKRDKLAYMAMQGVQIDTLTVLQDAFDKMQEEERNMRDVMVNDLNTFLESHFNDEAMMAEALQERQRQMTEAEKVTREFEERAKKTDAYILDLRRDHENAMKDVDVRHKQDIERLRRDHEQVLKDNNMTVTRLQTERKQLEEQVSALNVELASLSERNRLEVKEELESEYGAKLKHSNGVIESLQDMVNRNEQQAKSARNKTLTAVVITALLGGLFGSSAHMLYSESQKEDTPTAQVATSAPAEPTTDTTAEPATEPTTKDTADVANMQYVASAKGEGASGSLIIQAKESYTKGDKLDVVGSMGSKDDDVKRVIVSSVKDKDITVKTADKHQYTFTLVD